MNIDNTKLFGENREVWVTCFIPFSFPTIPFSVKVRNEKELAQPE